MPRLHNQMWLKGWLGAGWQSVDDCVLNNDKNVLEGIKRTSIVVNLYKSYIVTIIILKINIVSFCILFVASVEAGDKKHQFLCTGLSIASRLYSFISPINKVKHIEFCITAICSIQLRVWRNFLGSFPQRSTVCAASISRVNAVKNWRRYTAGGSNGEASYALRFVWWEVQTVNRADRSLAK